MVHGTGRRLATDAVTDRPTPLLFGDTRYGSRLGDLRIPL